MAWSVFGHVVVGVVGVVLRREDQRRTCRLLDGASGWGWDRKAVGGLCLAGGGVAWGRGAKGKGGFRSVVHGHGVVVVVVVVVSVVCLLQQSRRCLTDERRNSVFFFCRIS